MAVTVRKIVQDYDNEWWRRFSSCITENALERDVAIGISDARNGIDPNALPVESIDCNDLRVESPTHALLMLACTRAWYLAFT